MWVLRPVSKKSLQPNKRKLVEDNHQENLVAYCDELGINVSAFYILALEGETWETANRTIDYAIKLNTPLVRFSVSTPYPGTGFYNELKRKGAILTDNFENYTQFQLVFKHENFNPAQVRDLLSHAVRRYYFRPSYMWRMLKWTARRRFFLKDKSTVTPVSEPKPATEAPSVQPIKSKPVPGPQPRL